MQRLELRVIAGEDVRRLLPYGDCVEAVESAMRSVSAGATFMPLRQIMRLPGGSGALGTMPGYLGDPECFGIKLLSLFPGNPAAGLSSHLGLYMLCEAAHGRPVALLEASTLTAIRTAAASVAEALADADVVCTVTGSAEPLLNGADVRPGTHLCLVGASTQSSREVDDACVVMSRFYVDYRTSAMAQAGELLHAIGSGAIAESHLVAEIGEVLAGTRPGRGSDAEVTVYKSLGVAAQDLAAAALVYRRAVELGVGTLAPI